MNLSNPELAAAEYLAGQLAGRSYSPPRLVAVFNEQTLAGEGPAALLVFDLQPGPGCQETGDPRHYVAVGETVPNYFPAYGLAADDAYSLHIGTRFMLEMQIGRLDAAHEPPGLRDALRRIVSGVAPDAPLESEALAGLFQCEEQVFAVYRLTLGPAPTGDGGCTQRESVYLVAGDCPPGFYRLTQHPPQVALRLHLGKVIRAEPAERPGGASRGACA